VRKLIVEENQSLYLEELDSLLNKLDVFGSILLRSIFAKTAKFTMP